MAAADMIERDIAIGLVIGMLSTVAVVALWGVLL